MSLYYRAKRLLENTKRLRFFKGQMYDTDAEDYLIELHSFLKDFITAYEIADGTQF